MTARRKAERAQVGWGRGEWRDGAGREPPDTLIAGLARVTWGADSRR